MPRPTNVAAIVMAGGKGVRMFSPSPKMLMRILGKPLVMFPVEKALELVDGPVVVVSGDALDEMRQVVTAATSDPRLAFALQANPLGTADAVRSGLGKAAGADHVLILNGDVPCTPVRLLERLAASYLSHGADLSFIAFCPPDPTGYGRVIYDDSGSILAIREEKELDDEERSVDVVNAGLYLARYDLLADFLGSVEPSARQREYLLTDFVSFIVERGGTVDMVLAADPADVAGVNNRVELAEAAARVRNERNRELMLAGVGMPHPESVDVDFGIEVGLDTILEANVALRGATTVGSHTFIGRGNIVIDTTIGDHVRIQPYCVLESSVIELGCNVGPFAHTRPGTVLEQSAKVGNFVETKKTVIGAGSKASHLSYLGDAVIGKKVNVGAGTITCNYDGYNKFQTVLEDGVFVGSDTQLVAPVTVGRDAVIGAGTTVTRDVPPGALAISRVDQVHREGYADKKKQSEKKK